MSTVYELLMYVYQSKKRRGGTRNWAEMALITSIAGSKIGQFFNFPYWAVKLNTGRWISEVDNRQFIIDPEHPELAYKERRVGSATYDWSFDLVATGDILKIEQLWMFCPPSETSPTGNTATLFFASNGEEAGTAFMFNVSKQNFERRIDHKVIGKVTDRATGDCTCFIWDDELRAMSSPWKSNVYNFGTWRPGIPGQTGGVAPIPPLAHHVVGLRL